MNTKELNIKIKNIKNNYVQEFVNIKNDIDKREWILNNYEEFKSKLEKDKVNIKDFTKKYVVNIKKANQELKELKNKENIEFELNKEKEIEKYGLYK